MARTAKIRPPFVWLGKHTTAVSLIGTVGVGAFFRFYMLGSLPPGLDAGTATVGLQALNLLHNHGLPRFTQANDYNILWVFLQAVALKYLGHTALALRVVPAILGTVAIATTWLWIRSWFGLRVAWLTAFLLAVTPWAITISRSGSSAAMWPALVTLTLWLATLTWRSGGGLWGLRLAIALFLCLLAGPVGWLLVLCLAGVGLDVWLRRKNRPTFRPSALIGVIGMVLVTAIAIYWLSFSRGTLGSFSRLMSVVTSIPDFLMNLVKTLLMFNVSGDQNYVNNLSGEPLLNAFVGLMLVAGILVGFSRLHQRRYRLLFLLTPVMLLPALLTTAGAPNAARAATALPLVLAIAAIGISYMLELWYQTFPINSAARLTGQFAIFILLALTLFQGYTQYFRAWAGSSQVSVSYNQGAIQMAALLADAGTYKGQNVIVATPGELPVIAYLDYHGVPYVAATDAQILHIPNNPKGHQFIISAAATDNATKALKAKFAGGVLYPHYASYSPAGDAEIYYTYTVSK